VRPQRVSGLKPEQVRIHNAFLGGGFGRRDANDEIAQAIAIAKVVKRPVKLIWTRKKTPARTGSVRMRWSASSCGGRRWNADRMVDACRNLVDLQDRRHSVSGRSGRAARRRLLESNGYDVPNTRVEVLLKDTHLPVWFYRAPGGNRMSLPSKASWTEIASASGIDPYLMRRKLLKGKPDWLKVLDTPQRRVIGASRWREGVARHRHLHFYGQSVRAGRGSDGEAGRSSEGQSGHCRARYPSHGHRRPSPSRPRAP